MICQVTVKFDLLLLAGSIQLFVDPPLRSYPIASQVSNVPITAPTVHIYIYIYLFACVRVHASTYASKHVHAHVNMTVYWKIFQQTDAIIFWLNLYNFFFSKVTFFLIYLIYLYNIFIIYLYVQTYVFATSLLFPLSIANFN